MANRRKPEGSSFTVPGDQGVTVPCDGSYHVRSAVVPFRAGDRLTPSRIPETRELPRPDIAGAAMLAAAFTLTFILGLMLGWLGAQ